MALLLNILVFGGAHAESEIRVANSLEAFHEVATRLKVSFRMGSEMC